MQVLRLELEQDVRLCKSRGWNWSFTCALHVLWLTRSKWNQIMMESVLCEAIVSVLCEAIVSVLCEAIVSVLCEANGWSNYN